MPDFIHFVNGDGTLINTNQLVSVHSHSAVASKKDEEEENGYFKEGQTMYCIHLVLTQGWQKSLRYTKKERRDTAYKELIAALHPLVIGASAPPAE
jgi:hypothetical protein